MNSNEKTLIRLYGIVPFDRSAKARWILTELGLPFEDRWLDREKEEYNSPEFLRINPMGRAPAIEIGDVKLFESGAICAYLADRYIEQGLAPAFNSPHRADYQKWMYFAATTLDSFVGRIMIIEDIPAGEVLNSKMETFLTEVKDSLHTINLALEKNEFLVANQFSAADVCIAYHLYWCTLWPEMNSILEAHPHAMAYLNRLQGMPSALQAKVFSYEG